MQGSAKRNITLFKKLCGDDALQNVILATTMWDLVGEDVGAMREQELISTTEFWGYMASRGSKAYRHDNTHSSAMKLIGHFVLTESKMTLEIQEEMVHQHKDLDGTGAAATVDAQLEQERARFTAELHNLKAELEEAVRKKDHDTIDMLQEVREEYKSELAQIKTAHESLRASMQELHEERYANLERAMKEQQETYKTELSAAAQSLAKTYTPTNYFKFTADDFTKKPQAYGSQELNESTAENFSGREEHDSIIWDTMTGRRVSSVYSHNANGSSVTLSLDGRRFSTHSYRPSSLVQDSESTTKVWDTVTGKCLLTRKDDIEVSPDFTRFMSKSLQSSFQIYDMATGRRMFTIELPPPSNFGRPAFFSADGTRAIYHSREHIWTWDTETGQLVSKAYDYYTDSIIWSKSGTWLLKKDGGSFWMVNSTTGGMYYGPPSIRSIYATIWSIHGTMIAVSVNSEDTNRRLLIYAREGVELKCEIDGVKAYEGSITWSHDESMVAVLKCPADSTKVMIWNTVTGHHMSTLGGHNGDVYSMAWSRDGTRLASVSSDNTAKIWHVATGRCLLTLLNPCDPGHCTSVVWSLDEARLIAAIASSIITWDTMTGCCVSSINWSFAL